MGANAQTSVPTFTAGEVLTAANMNISARTGVPVFASTVTRDAAFGGTGEKTLAEGQLAYVEGTGLQSYNGSTWITWGAAPSASGVALVTAQSFSAVSSVSFANDTFSSSYRNYRVLFQIDSASTGLNMSCRIRVSGTDNTAASYAQGSPGFTRQGNTSDQADNFITSWTLGSFDTTATSYGVVLDVFSPKISGPTRVLTGSIVCTSASVILGRSLNLVHALTTAYDALSFIASTGDITGTYRVYGYADS